jgi:3-oxoacyl-[acyl-carrier-protein] synthase-3
MGDRDAGRVAFREDFKAIEERVPAMSVEILDELLAGENWLAADLDYLLPPQLSVRMTEQIVKQLGVSHAEEISCVAETGNAANALPFFQLERLLPRMGRGQRAVTIAVESSKWIKGGIALEKV